MPDRWLPTPRVYPFKCAISGRSSRDQGPYYEFPLEYREGEDGPICRLAISAKYLQMPFEKEDAPPTNESALRSECEDLRLTITELQSEIDTLEASLEAERDLFAKARAKRTGPTKPTGRRAERDPS